MVSTPFRLRSWLSPAHTISPSRSRRRVPSTSSRLLSRFPRQAPVGLRHLGREGGWPIRRSRGVSGSAWRRATCRAGLYSLSVSLPVSWPQGCCGGGVCDLSVSPPWGLPFCWCHRLTRAPTFHLRRLLVTLRNGSRMGRCSCRSRPNRSWRCGRSSPRSGCIAERWSCRGGSCRVPMPVVSCRRRSAGGSVHRTVGSNRWAPGSRQVTCWPSCARRCRWPTRQRNNSKRGNSISRSRSSRAGSSGSDLFRPRLRSRAANSRMPS